MTPRSAGLRQRTPRRHEQSVAAPQAEKSQPGSAPTPESSSPCGGGQRRPRLLIPRWEAELHTTQQSPHAGLRRVHSWAGGLQRDLLLSAARGEGMCR